MKDLGKLKVFFPFAGGQPEINVASSRLISVTFVVFHASRHPALRFETTEEEI